MFLKELFTGLFIYRKAHHVISEHRLWRWLAIPGIMSLGYILLLATLGIIYLPHGSAYINEKWMPEFMSGGVTYFIISLLLWLLLFILGFFSYKPIVLALFSPILSYLSETVEQKIYKEASQPFNINDFFKDIIRGIIINTRNTGWMFLFTGLAWIFAIIPLIGPLISPVLLILIQSYYGGFGLMDYTLERKRFSVQESIEFARENRALTMGVGLGFILLLLVPLLGWFFAPGYGATAATLATLNKMEKSPMKGPNRI